MTYGFIGTGNMGGALARALTKSVEAQSVQLCNRSPEKAKRLAEELGARLTLLPGDVAADCDVVFLGVKPHLLLDLLAELRPVLDGRRVKPLLVSMAAGVTIAAIEQAVPGCPVLRIMPNTACAVGGLPDGDVRLRADGAAAGEPDRRGKCRGGLRRSLRLSLYGGVGGRCRGLWAAP